MKTAGIIGGLDFLGCDITLKFLAENYRVKVLVPLWTKNYKPVINTGLKAGDNLEIFCMDMDNHVQLTSFIKDCDCLIHCGRPYELEVKTKVGPVYVPLITDTGNILKAVAKAPVRGKIVFLTSVGIFNNSSSDFSSDIHKISSESKNDTWKQAFYHSEMVIDNALGKFSNNRFEVIIVSPVVVIKNMLMNTQDSTLAGLQFLFKNKIDNDKVFKKLVKRNLMETMLEVNELPDKVFTCIQSFKEVADYSAL